MEAHRELVAAGRHRLALAGVNRSSPSSRCPSADSSSERWWITLKMLGIAVVRGAQHGAVRLLLARDRDLARAGDHRRAVAACA